MKLNVVIRTCDKHSLQSKRIVNKKECIIRCLNSVLNNLDSISNKSLHIIDDNSTKDFKKILNEMVSDKDYISIDYLGDREDNSTNPRKKSRYSLSKALNYIYSLPDDELVYLLEDDYLHFPNVIEEIIDVWKYLKEITGLDVGIFPQDFNQLYFHPTFPFNDVYVTKCMVVPTQKRYYRTTWFTQESFVVSSNIFRKYKEDFNKLLDMGDEKGHIWEGSTISNVWNRNDFNMFMPLGSLVIHMSQEYDTPFLMNRKIILELWENNKTFWSKNVVIKEWQDSWPRLPI